MGIDFMVWSLLEPPGPWPPGVSGSLLKLPRCLPDASQVPPRYFADAPQMHSRWLPPQRFVLYDSSSKDSSSMIPRHSFLFHDSSNWFTKKLCLGSRAGVTSFSRYLFKKQQGFHVAGLCTTAMSSQLPVEFIGENLKPILCTAEEIDAAQGIHGRSGPFLMEGRLFYKTVCKARARAWF